MLKSVKKICIIGGSGTGKTTLSNNLAKELNIPVCHIDGIHHLENWEIRDEEERDNIIFDKIKENEWIIDGTYHSTLKQRAQKAELIIYLDYSSISQVKGVLRKIYKKSWKRKTRNSRM